MHLNQAMRGSWMWCASSLKTASSSISRTISPRSVLLSVVLPTGLGPNGCEEVVAQIVVFERRLAHVAEEDAVDVGEEEVAGVAHDAHVVLDVQRELEIVAPVAAVVAVVGQDRVVEEDVQAVEIGAQPVEHDDVRRDQQEVARQRRVGLVELVEEAPGDQQREDLGLARAGGHLHDVARPVLVEHAGARRRRRRRSAAGRTCRARGGRRAAR